MKLFVRVSDASYLMPKDGHGSSNPFVEVEFDQQLHRTQTKYKDLNPVWNETLVFNVSDPNKLPNQVIDVVVYNDRNSGHQRNFLGRVRISGVSVPFAESEAVLQRYPLDKRGLFSNIRGDIALQIYAVRDLGEPSPPSNGSDTAAKTNDAGNEPGKKKMKKKNQDKETQSWYSIGNGAPHQSDPVKPIEEEMKRSDFFRKEHGPMLSVQHMHAMPFPPEAAKMGMPVEAAFLRAREGKRRMGLVDQMEYLYVKVEKARDLPTMDVTGSLDPYVEVKVGNYKGVTKYVEKSQKPVWNQVFAFPKERLQANRLEVVLKDKDLVKDDFVGRIIIDLAEIPRRVPPDGPLAPTWYKLENKDGEKVDKLGEVMLAVWMGTQADQCFPDTLHADAHSLSPEAVAHTRSGVYHSPKLFYLRLHIIEAQDLVPSDKTRPPDILVKVELTPNQVRFTRPSPVRTHNPVWNEELMFVASEPLSEQQLILTVEDRVGPNKRDPLGWVILRLSDVATFRSDHYKPVDPHWFNLGRPHSSDESKKEVKFASKIHLRVCLEGGYHVLDESTHYSSDLQPSDKHLWTHSIGLLEVGIIGASHLLPMKTKEGGTTDAYCVAKYGSKWVRTRTHLDTLAPRWNEQYTWEVSDPCTVITLSVFHNSQILDKKATADQPIGKVRVRLSTLETDRVYAQSYPLLLLQPSGLKSTGELHVALRFTCTAWLNMMTLYARPLLPKMHYLHPIPVVHVDILRRHAVQIVAARMARAEPPLRPEAVAYVLDVDHHMWSLRRSKANFERITSLFSCLLRISNFFEDVRDWKNPITTCLVIVAFFILVCYPELILPTVFLYLFMVGIWNYRFRPRGPPRMDPKLSHAVMAHPDELDEEFDTFPTTRPMELVRMRYDRLRSVAGRVQTVGGDLATQGERVQAILSWRDPRATGIFVIFSMLTALTLYVVPFQVVVLLGGLYMLRHPRFRARKMPSVPVNFFKRLPSKSDLLL
ncbi:FT-interacting protein 7-like [Aristolochia californica]|uniref:FT-interacting protein 7-like n=1 Tax=Aristolochia californica TaxID=171875 RepID=UPI0035DF945E